MGIEPNKLDGVQSFTGGMNQSLPPSFLDKDKSYKNINVSIKNGKISPRPKFIEVQFDLGDYAQISPALGSLYHSHNVLSGRIQHAGRFKTSLGEVIIFIINGVIYAASLATRTIKPLINKSQPRFANYLTPRLYGNQAYNYYVIYDWPNQPIIIDNNLVVRRASIQNVEIPRSYLGAFVHNRLFVANKGVEFGASDPVSPSNPNSPLTFLDSIVTVSNPSPAFPEQFFSLSYIERLSSITAMGYFEKSSTSIGYGPLFVSTKEAIYAFNVNVPRTEWEKSVFGSVLVQGIGIVGPKAFTVVGGDIWYRAANGLVYSISTVASDQQRWGVSNISREIEESLYTKNKELLRYSALEYVDNTIITHLRPYVTKALNIMGVPIEDYVFNGLGVVELNTISGLGGGSNPIWASLYSLPTTDIIKTDDGMFFVGKSKHDDNVNCFYLMDKDENKDYYGQAKFPVHSRIYTREFDMQAPLQEKRITHVNLDIRNITGKFEASIYAKHKDEWEFLGEISVNNVDSIQDELIAITTPITLKTTILRIDLIGEYYEFNRAFIVGEVHTELQLKREFDEITCITEEEYVGDMNL